MTFDADNYENDKEHGCPLVIKYMIYYKRYISYNWLTVGVGIDLDIWVDALKFYRTQGIYVKDYNQFKIDRNYNYQDIITVSKDTIPDYDEKVRKAPVF